MAETAGPAFDLATQEGTLDFITSVFDGLRGELPLSLDVTGPSVFATTTSRVIRSEMQDLTLSSAVLVILLLIAAFRSLPLVCVLLLPLGFGVCAGALAVQALFGELHGITLGLRRHADWGRGGLSDSPGQLQQCGTRHQSGPPEDLGHAASGPA